MGTVTEKKDYMLQTKEQIRSAINSKGIAAAPDEPFRAYAGKIGSIKTIPATGNILYLFHAQTDASMGWNFANIESLIVENGYVKATAKLITDRYDPSIQTITDSLLIDASKYKYVVVRMRVTGVTASTQNPQIPELYFITKESPTWYADKRCRLTSHTITTVDTDWDYYVFDMRNIATWTGTVNSIRIDPFDNSLGTFYIESVLVCKDYVAPAENQLVLQIKEVSASFVYDKEVYTDSAYDGLSNVIVKRISSADIWSYFIIVDDPGNVYNLPFGSGFNAGDFVLSSPPDWDHATNLGIITEDGRRVLFIPSNIFVNNIGNLSYLSNFKLSGDRIIQGQSFSELVFEQGITDLKYTTIGFENPNPLFLNLYDGDWNIIGEPCSVGIIRIPNSVTQISSNLFSETGNPTIIIDKESDSISGSPWGANGATTIWLRG